jgi:hypothetical protein
LTGHRHNLADSLTLFQARRDAGVEAEELGALLLAEQDKNEELLRALEHAQV